jgi:hypothetical protein
VEYNPIITFCHNSFYNHQSLRKSLEEKDGDGYATVGAPPKRQKRDEK